MSRIKISNEVKIVIDTETDSAMIGFIETTTNTGDFQMANLSLTNAKRVAAKLEAAGILVNRMGKRNDNRYSL